ncbi:MAG: HAMP domain-containing sensor histidine kinase [Tissierellia bacterium]|nr:HAMP domain-containing sensor histidine kinase [Tissierellia bacterium]
MEDNKCYKFRNNILILLFISTIISLGSFIYFTNNMKRGEANQYYINEIENVQRETIRASLNDYYVYPKFPYYVKSFKTKYYLEDGTKIPDVDGKKMYDKYMKQEELRQKGLDPLAYSEELAKKVIKKNEIFFINDKRMEIDPEDVEFGSNDFLIKGVATNGNVAIELIETSGRLESNPLKDVIVNGFVNNTKNLISKAAEENQIKNIKFCYTLDLDSQVFQDIKANVFYQGTMFPVVLSSFVLNIIVVAIGAFLLRYKEWKKTNGIPILFRLPIEIILILIFFYVFFGLVGLSNYERFYRGLPENFLQVFYSIFILCLIVGNFISGLCIFYAMISGKSLIYEGKNAFIIQRSIIYRLITGVIQGVTTSVGEAETEHTVQKAKSRVLMVEIGLFLLSIIYFLVFHIRNPFLSIIIFTILLVISYRFMIRLINEIATINRSSSEIAKGNYQAKVDNNFPIYQKIADNFNNIGENLNLAIDEAVKSERMKSELVTNVSHDLKTPLTSIINYSDLLQDKELSEEEYREYSQIIYEKSQKLKTLIEDLFEISKVTSRNIVLELEDIDFKSLLLQVTGEWEDKLEEKSIQLISNMVEDPIILRLDGSKMSRVLDNIFSNIEKYAMEGSRVYIDLEEDNSQVKLEIKNMSKYPLNISADELKERFIRGDISRTTEGAGLGLSIAESLVEAQNGTFDIEIDGDLFKTKIYF